MKKIFTLAALALMTSMMFVGCSSDDDNNTQPTPTPAPAPTPDPDPTPTPDNPLAGTWTVVTDGWMQYTVSTFVMSNKPIVDYSAANTSVNPTIPAGTPTYSLVTNDVDPTTGTTSNFSKEEGYYTLPEPVVTTNAAGETVSTIPSMGTITLWPQVVMTSFDGSTWTATPKANMVSRHEYTYQKIGNVLVLTRGDKTTATFTSKPTPAATTVPADAFFKSWTLPNDLDPTITTSLLMSAQPITNFIPAGATNPTIPAGTPSYVKEVRPTDPTAAAGGTWSREIGYFTLPASTTTQTEGGTSVTTLPATGKITFWPQSTMTSVDGTTWTTEQPTGQTPTMREYTYTMYGNVMLLTGADKSTLTYYTTTVIAQ